MDIFSRYQGNGIPNARPDVLNRQGRIVILDDLLERESFIHEFEDVLYRDACAGYTRFPEMHFGIDNDPFHFHSPRKRCRVPIVHYLNREGNNVPMRAWACLTARLRRSGVTGKTPLPKTYSASPRPVPSAAKPLSPAASVCDPFARNCTIKRYKG
jgi:hypothetical protein